MSNIDSLKSQFQLQFHNNEKNENRMNDIYFKHDYSISNADKLLQELCPSFSIVTNDSNYSSQFLQTYNHTF